MFPRRVQPDERLVVFRLGALGPNSVKGPGVAWLLLPGIVDRGVRVDLSDRMTEREIAATTLDGRPARMRVRATWRVVDALLCVTGVLKVDDGVASVVRNAADAEASRFTLADLPWKLDELSTAIQTAISAVVMQWGIETRSVRVTMA